MHTQIPIFILLLYLLLFQTQAPDSRILQGPIDPFTNVSQQSSSNITTPVLSSSNTEGYAAISIEDLIAQWQNQDEGTFDPSELTEFQVSNITLFGDALTVYYSEFYNDENEFGEEGLEISHEDFCSMTFINNNGIVATETSDASRINITNFEMSSKGVNTIKYTGRVCQCWITLYEKARFGGISWTFRVSYLQGQNGEDGGSLDVGDKSKLNYDCETVNPSNTISSYDIHCYNFYN